MDEFTVTVRVESMFSFFDAKKRNENMHSTIFFSVCVCALFIFSNSSSSVFPDAREDDDRSRAIALFQIDAPTISLEQLFHFEQHFMVHSLLPRSWIEAEVEGHDGSGRCSGPLPERTHGVTQRNNTVRGIKDICSEDDKAAARRKCRSSSK